MKTATPVAPINELNSAYFLPTESQGAVYPAIQFSQYRSIGLTQELNLVISPESLELMDLDQAQSLGLNPQTCVYFDKDNKRSDTEMFAIASSVRWVVLHRPQTGYVTSPEGIRRVKLGDKFKEMGLKTIAKVFLGAVVDGKFILDGEGKVQIFTLKLNSSKTNLIISQNAEQKTFDKLNQALCKAHNVSAAKNWITHLASIELRVFPDTFVGKDGSSVGPNLEIVGDAVKLAPDQQKLAYELGISEDFKDLCADPFGLAKRGVTVAETALGDDGHPGYTEADCDIAF
jgi:hypothetical protein